VPWLLWFLVGKASKTFFSYIEYSSNLLFFKRKRAEFYPMAIKSLDNLTIFVTERMMTALETLTHKNHKEKTISHLYSNTYNQYKIKSPTPGRIRPNRNGFPSPNARCGFATGDAI
jgi:hypothetical protein